MYLKSSATRVYVRITKYIYICVGARAHICKYIYIHVYMCIYLYEYAYIHTYILEYDCTMRKKLTLQVNFSILFHKFLFKFIKYCTSTKNEHGMTVLWGIGLGCRPMVWVLEAQIWGKYSGYSRGVQGQGGSTLDPKTNMKFSYQDIKFSIYDLKFVILKEYCSKFCSLCIFVLMFNMSILCLCSSNTSCFMPIIKIIVLWADILWCIF